MDVPPTNIVLRMLCQLDGDITAPQWQAGTQVTGFIPEQANKAYTIMQLAYTNRYGYLPPFNEWLLATTNGNEFDPSICFIVSNTTGMIAFAQCWTSGFIKDFVVNPAVQGQGIGHALLLHVL